MNTIDTDLVRRLLLCMALILLAFAVLFKESVSETEPQTR